MRELLLHSIESRASRARVERVSSASRARASVNLWVDGTVVFELLLLLSASYNVFPVGFQAKCIGCCKSHPRTKKK